MRKNPAVIREIELISKVGTTPFNELAFSFNFASLRFLIVYLDAIANMNIMTGIQGMD
jgi:hypothetical protein